MPGPATNTIRFGGTYGTVNGSTVTVNIIDRNYSSTPNNFTIDDGGGGLKDDWLTNEKEFFNYIDTRTVRLSMFIDSEEVQSFFDDLTTAEEGRFFLQLKNGSNTVFLGKILVDEMTLAIEYNPSFTFTAIDGITDLKNIDYTGPYFDTVKDVILNCLNKMQTAVLYNTGETILMCQTNLMADTSISMIRPFETIRVTNYFYKVENDIQKPLKCYDVLKELCGRLFCQIVYDKGKYTFFGMEGLTENRLGSYVQYDKTGALVSGSSPSNITTDIEQFTLDGGKYIYSGGFNEVILNVEKEFTNKVYGDGEVRELVYPSISSHGYVPIGTKLSGLGYQIKIKNIVSNLIWTGVQPQYIRIKYTVKTTDLPTATITYADYYFNYPFYGFIYNEVINLAATTNDKTIEIFASFDSFFPSGSFTVSNINQKFYYLMTKNKETDTTYFKAYLSSNNVKTKVFNNIASDRYGKDMVKFYLWDGNVSNDRVELEEGWKFASGDTYKGLESSIVKRILSVLRTNQKTLTIGINVKSALTLDNLRKYTYRNETFRLISCKRNYLEDVAICTFVKIPTPNNTGIVVIEDIPAVNGVNGFNQTTEYTTSTKILATVASTTYTIVYDIPSDASFESLVNSIDVFVEGVLWRQVSSIGTKRNCYTINSATKLITFSRSLDNSNIIIKINKAFTSESNF